MAGLELIEEIEVTAGGLATIDFDNIPATYNHLEIKYMAQTEGALAAIKVAFNTDTTDGNYQTERILGTANSTPTSTTFNGRYAGAVTATGDALPAIGDISLPYYASTLGEHGLLARVFYRTGSQNYNDHWFCQWNSTAAIDRVRLTVDGGADFKEGSIFSLYGLPADVPADLKISDLSAITTLDGTEEFVVADTGTTKKIAASDFVGMVPLYDELLGSNQASFDVTSISGACKHLQVVLQLRGTAAAQNVVPSLRFNNASGASDYEWALNYSNATLSDSGYITDGADSFIRLGFCPAASATANRAGTTVINISNYAATTFQKSCTFENIGMAVGGSNESYRADGGGAWFSTAAINRITIFPSSGSWLAGSRITIYGLA